jgi:hypothetical protein
VNGRGEPNWQPISMLATIASLIDGGLADAREHYAMLLRARPKPFVLRHRHSRPGGTDLVIVAELLGHARLETTRIYTRPSAEDRTRALDLLPADK